MKRSAIHGLFPVARKGNGNKPQKRLEAFYRRRSIFEANMDNSDTSCSPLSKGFIGDLAKMANYVAGLSDSLLDENIEVQNFMRLAWKYYAFYLRMIGRRFFEQSFLEFVQFLERESGRDDSLNWTEIWDFSLYVDSVFQSKALIEEI
ncbi:MAG: hypothetical protein ACOY5B_08355 [Spirochaetota bacterium]